MAGRQIRGRPHRTMTLDPAAGASASHLRLGGTKGIAALFEVSSQAPEASSFGLGSGDVADTGAFPNLGVSLGVLRKFCTDPRFQQPMVELPLVEVEEGHTTVSPPTTAAGLDGLHEPELRAVARRYRAFSALDEDTERAIYDGTQPTFKACDHRHPLEPLSPTDSTETDSCDVCKADGFPVGTGLHRCQAGCSFGLCPACYESRVPINGRRELLAALLSPPTTTTQVVECIIKPDTLDAGCSYGQMQLERGGEDAAGIGRPTIFLSHAWRHAFLELVDALVERHAGVPAAEVSAVRVWNDIFVEDQNSTDSKPAGYFFSTFKDAVAQIGHTVLVLAPWDNPIPLTRAWCLWEVYSAMEAGATLEVVVSKTEIEKLRDAVLARGSKAVTDVMLDIDGEKAQCFMQADREQIFAAIRVMEGGFHCLNVNVRAHLRAWVLKAVRGLCADPGWTDDDGQRARMFNQAGSVLRANGDLHGAVEHMQQALAIREASADPEPRKIATLYNNIGQVFKEQGDYTGALARFETGLALQEAELEPGHPSIAISHNNIGMVLLAQGDFAGALLRHEASLRMREATLEPGHPDIARSHNNIGQVLAEQGDCVGALPCLEMGWRMREAALDPGHPDIATSHANIGRALEGLSDHAGALTQYELGLAILETALGPGHPSTVQLCADVDRVRKMPTACKGSV